jgi:hypothetical protein
VHGVAGAIGGRYRGCVDNAGADRHCEWAERAEQLADEARALAGRAIAAAERHERLGREAVDGRGGELHVGLAKMYRDAQAIYESAAALQAQHADHERRFAERVRTRSPRPQPLPSVDATGLTPRYAHLARQQGFADRRDAVADEREQLADSRDRVANDRERRADERDATATAREDQLDNRERRLDETYRPGHTTGGPRRRLARAHDALERTGDRIRRQEQDLDRVDAQRARDQALIDRESSQSQRDSAAEDGIPDAPPAAPRTER